MCSCCIFFLLKTVCLPGHSRTDSFSPSDLRQKWCWLWRQSQTGNVFVHVQTFEILGHWDPQCILWWPNLTLCFCFTHLQLIEVTGKTQDECMVALHDCNEDVNRAINFLLESTSDTVRDYARTRMHTHKPFSRLHIMLVFGCLMET